ncbi:hypothetical protein [Nocardia cyriacigeorgica]|uniref:hypothetical protein n=1 Tax=Nocardia cyriacigeorgica TaxID=135487 RepID=UPI002453FED0|nr:hypothetical protein [Nocardia cyriacigeorgica]
MVGPDEPVRVLELPGLRIDADDPDAGIAKFDLQFTLTENPVHIGVGDAGCAQVRVDQRVGERTVGREGTIADQQGDVAVTAR